MDMDEELLSPGLWGSYLGSRRDRRKRHYFRVDLIK
jgi:hypothetical protein